MPCIQQHEHCHTVHFLQVRTEEVFTEKFARVGAVWGSVGSNIRWHYEVLLWSSWSDDRKLLRVAQNVNVVLPVEHHEKLCFIVPSFEAGTVLLSKMCCRFIQWNI